MSQSNLFVCNFQLKTLMFIKTQKIHTFTVDGLINRGVGGLISGIIYSFESGWVISLGGGGLKVGFYGMMRDDVNTI